MPTEKGSLLLIACVPTLQCPPADLLVDGVRVEKVLPVADLHRVLRVGLRRDLETCAADLACAKK